METVTFYYKKTRDWSMRIGASCWNGLITTGIPFTEKITIYEEPRLMNVNVTGDSVAWIEKYAVKEVGNYTYAPIGSEFRSILRMSPKNITFGKKMDQSI